MRSENADYLQELLDSATSLEEVAAVEALLAEESELPETHTPETTTNANRWTVKTLGEVAGFFGVALQTVKQWRTESHPMPGEPGVWNLQDISRWRFEKLSNRRGNSDDDSASSGKGLLECKKLEVEVAHKRLRLKEHQGRLVDREVWDSSFEQICHMIRTRLPALPDEFCTALPPDIQADTVADWKAKVDLILREMSNWTPPAE